MHDIAHRPGDKSALMLLALIGSMIANLLLLSQIFVWRPEYVAEIKEIHQTLERIESQIVNRAETRGKR